MTFGVQFQGSVTAGETRRWFTHSWNAANNVVWIVVPTAPAVDGNAQLEWKVQSTRRCGAFLRHRLLHCIKQPLRRPARIFGVGLIACTCCLDGTAAVYCLALDDRT